MRSNPLTLMGAVAFVALVLLTASAFTVRQSQQAIVLQLGEPVRELKEPGLYWKVPFFQNVVFFDRRVLNFDAPSVELPTLDQKQVVISAFVRYRIVDPLKFYRVGKTENNAESQIRGVLGSSLRKVVGGAPMAEILTAQRADLMSEINDSLRGSVAEPYGIEIIDVRLKRVDLPATNSEAVYNRMRTQRAQEARKFRAEGDREARITRADADKDRIVKLAEARKTAEILRGEGDAEATRIYNDAFGRDPAFFDFYRSLQAMRQGLNADHTTYVGTPEGDFFRFFGGQAVKKP